MLIGLVKKCVVGLIMFCQACTAYAWGREGHRIVGDIAELHLTIEAQQAVARLLADDRLSNGKRSGRSKLGEVASWADEIRSVPAMKHTKPWHFDDIPLCGTASAGQVCPNGNCASQQLARLAEVLRDARAPIREQNEALKWVVHLMGDIHQPLHTTDNADFGGNKVLVSFLGKTSNDYGDDLNLHAVWDESVLSRLLRTSGGTAMFVTSQISTAELDRWLAGTARDWIDESHAYAASTVYGKLPGGYICGATGGTRVDLGQDYDDAAAPVVALQLRRAGVRLARVINTAFSTDASGFSVQSLRRSAAASHPPAVPHLPDPDMTPGRAAKRTAKAVCGMANTRDERHVTEGAKKAAYAAYGVARCEGYCSGSEGCEVDHLISLELGGVNTADNLWPQPYQGIWNAHDKDRLENRLKAMVCREKSISLAQAQAEVATDWIAAYRKYLGAPRPFKAVRRCPPG